MHGIQRVDFEKLDALSLSLARASREMSTTLTTMDLNLSHLQSQFTGEAANAYQRAKAQWSVQMAEMTAYLGTISEAAASAKSALSSTESKIITKL